MGHPWPCAATSASMPRCPLRNACVRPAWFNGASRSRSRSRSRSKAEQERGVSQHLFWLSHRYREQARSHMVLQVFTTSAHNPKICGSGLAREEAGTFNIFIDCENAFASEPAREEASAFTSSSTVPSPSRAGSLPQGKHGPIKNQVGYQAASLLLLICQAPLTTMAERRHCGAGNPAWMPG